MKDSTLISLSLYLVLVLLIVTSIPWSLASESNPNNTTNTTSSADNRLSVVTSVSPITNIIKNVGGDRIALTGLIPEGVNSHTFKLVLSDVVKVNNADLVIIDGLGLETNVEDVSQEGLKAKILNCRF